MIEEEEPRVLEFNVRFGDPECQPLLLRMDEDLVPLLRAAADGSLTSRELRWREGTTCCVVMASDGYPGAYDKGVPIRGLDDVQEGTELVVFHAGTALADGESGPEVVTAGGRVLGVTTYGEDALDARNKAYDAMETIRWVGAVYRRDIGQRAVNRLKEEG